jgi:CspA family cold shock protein
LADGYKSLKEGARVSFELTEGSKGLMAANIRPENSAQDTAPAPPDSAASDTPAPYSGP